MDNKFYVSYEVARLLQEKGYDKKRDFLTPVYKENGGLYWSNHEDLSYKIPAITKAEAIDWLESKGIMIDVLYRNLGLIGKRHYGYIIHTFNEDGSENIDSLIYYPRDFMDSYFSTRLEAEEDAIIKALEML